MSDKKKIMTSGNLAFAEAMRQIDPDVVAAYPITPSTEIPMKFAEFAANGKVTSEYIAVESEHSAISACVGACIFDKSLRSTLRAIAKQAQQMVPLLIHRCLLINVVCKSSEKRDIKQVFVAY